MGVNLLFQCLLSFLLCYASFVSIYISFFKKTHFNFLTLFFTLPLASFAVFSIYNAYQFAQTNLYGQKRTGDELKVHFFKKNKWLVILLIICFVSFLFGLFNVYTQYTRGTFVDELTQFLRSVKLSSVLEAASMEQQPPLDYYFSAFVSELWDQQSKFSLRFHAMIFYLLLSFMIPMGLYRFCSSFAISIAGTILFLINHVIYLHSVYARPLSLALLTGFLFLFFYLSYCDNKHNVKKPLFPVIASQYLFVMSIGLQPVVLILSLFLSSFWLLFENKKHIFKRLLLSHFMTALLALPIYLNMMFISYDLHKFNLFSFETIIRYFNNLDVPLLFKNYFFPFYEQMILFLLLLCFMLVVMISIRKKISTLIAIMLTALILFPLIYDMIFHIIIKWPFFNEWYFIVLSLPLILFVIISLKEINLYMKQKRLRIPCLTLITLLFFYTSYLQIVSIKSETRYHFPYMENNIEEIYAYLREKGKPNDIAMDFSLNNILDTYGSDVYLNRFLFYKPKLHPKVISRRYLPIKLKYKSANKRTFGTYYINPKLFQNGNQKLFLITADIEDRVMTRKAHSVLSSFMTGQKFGSYIVFELKFKTSNKEKEYMGFLYSLLEKTPKEQSTILYETLLYYACEQANARVFQRLLKEYRELEPYFQDMDIKHKFPKYFELRRRAKYFENKNCEKN